MASSARAAAIAEAVSGADAAIICSPSTTHFEQARECLEHGVHTLVEMPPCENAAEAEELARLARPRGVKLGCAHTSRFVAPFARVKKSMESGVLGGFRRSTTRVTTNFASAVGRTTPFCTTPLTPSICCFTGAAGLNPKDVWLFPTFACLKPFLSWEDFLAGGAATITVTYASRIHHIRMMIVGENHTIETDGFSYANSDLPELEFRGDEQETYEEAIHLQDVEFLRACQGKGNFVSWDETFKVLQTIDGFRALGA